MTGLVWNLVIDGLHVAAAVGAILLVVRLLARREAAGTVMRRAALALGISAVWAIASAAMDPEAEVIQLLVSATYFAWLWLLFALFAHDERDKSLGPVKPVIFVLTFLELVQVGFTFTRMSYAGDPAAQELLLNFAIMFRLLFCIGALVLVHNLYVGAAQQARRSLQLPAAALAVLWLYDLNLYTIAYLASETPAALIDLRSLAILASTALLGFGMLRADKELRFKPSRSFAFRSFSLAIIGAYLLVMVLIAQAIAYAGRDFSPLMQFGFVIAATGIALAFLPSQHLRSWLRVTISKHLFQHRYDYRAEWLRFTDTIGRAGPQAAPLHERAVQAVADITDSPRGLLLTPRDEGGMTLDARWNWPQAAVPAEALSIAGARFFEESQFILDIDDLRNGRTESIPAAACPQWLLEDQEAWAMVPLLHYERLLAVVILSRPPVARLLDWEDFDLLRVIGRQLASYLAEQTSQDALGEAQRFDEFNRRIAFVMHDIKNLASQLSLLAGNAEKHAEKPEFRADMILTLRNSTDKLQALLNRLGRYGAQGGGAHQPFDLNAVIDRVAAQFTDKHQVVLLERDECAVNGDPEALEQALVHLVQNAIDASRPATPVFIDQRVDGANATIEVVDSGSGMSPEFVRTKLFKPFHSSKQGGFGIGAFESRELVRAMGGRLDVESREGIGTRFIIVLPLSEAAKLMNTLKGNSNNNAEVA
ncbi:XrtA/PEP-CTERM system histidine kinase PrsK [Alteraurantiacibacter aquimixticola]|uniref:histidine kinase n=1 Tax=Alteraurantiacibacter aquimixticola TaxID=2489173 RepID=A0A4V4U930_9SPHN|nr:XrtA/PEP-CTERM system histidine kinase PrsK [Alteraurantiacibacter aquimixticola]TIX50203.1 PEP-CTERM system histidine kinase PrsK [Alteraurantiacibacter aquimixticola]